MEPEVGAALATMDATLGRLLEQSARQTVEIINLGEQIKRQNGRVTKNEDTLTGLRILHAQQDGANVASKKYVTLVGGLAALSAPFVTALFLKLLGIT